MPDLQPHQQRVVVERDELADRLAKLEAFLNRPDFGAIVTPAEQPLLRAQAMHMRHYLAVLNGRIALW